METEICIKPISPIQPAPIVNEDDSSVEPTLNEANQSLSCSQTPNQSRGLRVLDENIIANQLAETVKISDSKASVLKEGNIKTENVVKDPESVTRLLEKLLAERNRLVELGIIKKEALTEKTARENRENKLSSDDQENVDPSSLDSATPYNSNTRTVKSRQSAGATRPYSHNIRSIESTINKFNHYLPNSTTKINAKSQDDQVDLIEDKGIENKITIKASQVAAKTPKAENKPKKVSTINDLLYISKTTINYGETLPGQILEESLELANKSDENVVVQILVECLNSELADTDEYVFAIRRSHSSDYNDKHFIIMSPYSSAHFKLALKTPSIRMKDTIKAETIFSIQGMQDNTKIQMECKQVIPKIVCPKELYSNQMKCKVIKLVMKGNKKAESRIPIKNLSDTQVTLDFEFFKPKDETSFAYDCLCSPSYLNINGNSLGVLNIAIKPSANMSYINDGKSAPKSFTRVLTARCRDTSLIYSFVFSVDICE